MAGILVAAIFVLYMPILYRAFFHHSKGEELNRWDLLTRKTRSKACTTNPNVVIDNIVTACFVHAPTPEYFDVLICSSFDYACSKVETKYRTGHLGSLVGSALASCCGFDPWPRTLVMLFFFGGGTLLTRRTVFREKHEALGKMIGSPTLQYCL